MKRSILLLFLLFFLLSLKTTGQNPISLTNSGFESWSTGNGYSVSVSFFGFPISLPVYSDYIYPTGWNFPTYPVNETINYSGTDVNVNTDLPLLKVTDETSGVPEGSHAVKLQSFMLSDIINSTVYNLASSNLDEWLTTTVFPTVLTTGAVDIDQLLPLVEDFTNSFDSLPLLLAVFDSVDLNSIIDGGIPMNGAAMGRMTGYYKYTSGVGGDKGGIMMLGSKYNPATQRREVVGGGYTANLTDVSAYTSFEIAYTPLSEIDSTAEYVEADSLVILIFSSANSEPQQGSSLYLDNLQLWSAVPVIPEDTTTTDTVPNICDPTYGDTIATACGNFSWHGYENLTESGDYMDTLVNAGGCDSILTLHLTIYTSVTESVEATICESELPYTWNGIVFENDGTDSAMLTSSTGCDSLVIMTLTVTRINTGLNWVGTSWYAIEMEAAQENAEYQWIDCETNEWIENATEQLFEPVTSGSYACIITYNGCTDTTSCLNAIVGISENSTTDLILYPNPTTGIVTVQLPPETCNLTPEIQMFDIYGRRLQIIPVTDETTPIDLSRYANGVYFVKLVNNGKVVAVRKVVKE